MAKAKKNSSAKDCGKQGKTAKNALNSNTRQPWFKQGYLMVRAPELIEPIKNYHKQSNFVKQVKTPKNSGDSLINMLTTSPRILHFFNGTPVDYSQLVPHIQLYKVYIHNNGKGPEDVEEVAFPFRSFQNFDDWDATKFTQEQNRRFFRGTDAGIQSINLKMEGRGRNPVSANIMDITIKFFFNDVKTLFDRNVIPGSLKGDSDHSISYSDLIRFPPSLRKSTRSFRIRLVVGWSVNKQNPLFQEAGEDFVRAVESSKISVAADLYTHNMEFDENGSLILTARYKGALESAFSSQVANILNNGTTANQKDPDVISIESKISRAEKKYLEARMTPRLRQESANLEAIEAATRELAALRENIEKAKDKKGNYAQGSEAKLIAARLKLNKAWNVENERRRKKSPYKALTSLSNGIKDPNALKESEIEKENAATLARQKKSLDKASKTSKVSGKDKRKKVRALRREIKKLKRHLSEYKKAMKGQQLFAYVEKMRTENKIAWVATGNRTKFGNYEKLVELLQKEGGTDRIKKRQERLESRIRATKDDKGTQAKDKVKKNSKRRKKSSRTRTSNAESQVWKFTENRKYVGGDKMYFFRLGDLLTAILEHGDFAKKLAEEAPDFRIILGEYDIPGLDNSSLRVNLYDLPISIEIFHIFVAQKIVGTGRDVYPLLQFTFDLIKFVMDKTQGVFGKAADFSKFIQTPVSFKMDMTSVDLPKDEFKRIDKQKNPDIISLGDNEGDLNTLFVSDIKNTSNAFVLHAQRRRKNGESTIYNGKITEDIPRGIFHFFVGGPNRGILKKIDFTQAGNSLFSTALMRNGQANGLESSREGVIQPSKFACELTLVGNPFFFIGQMFYVNTELISGGAFRKEGILNGGYYIVTAVENSFTSDRWETKLRGTLNIPDHALKIFHDKSTKTSELSEEERKKINSMAADASQALEDAARPGAKAGTGVGMKRSTA